MGKCKLPTGLLVVLAIMFVFSASLIANPERETVEFPDHNLELAIREEIGEATGDVYPSDLEGLTTLHARHAKIEDLTGISECKDLKQLLLDGNDISDLSPLSELNNLQVLWLGSNGISNLTTISDLTNLVFLRLHLNNITDISPLTNLTNLRRLNLSFNNISDISLLSELTNLKSLDLRGNKVSDLSPLSELYSLQTLRLNRNNISDTQPLIDNFKVKENGTKIGLGVGDKVLITHNKLDLSEGSDDLKDIQTLLDRGIEVEFYPQKKGESS